LNNNPPTKPLRYPLDPPLPHRQNWEIVKDLTKTYDAMSVNDGEDPSKQSTSLKHKEAYNRKRDKAKESKAEENKGSEDLLLKKIESITTGESGSEYEKPSVVRLRSFNTQSYSTDLGSEYPKDSSFPEIKRPRSKILSKKRNPSENKWVKSMEPIDPTKPLDHTNAKPWVPELSKPGDSSSERSNSQRSRAKSKKRSKRAHSGSASIERSRREEVKQEGEYVIMQTVKKESAKKVAEKNWLEEFRIKECEFMNKIEVLSRDKAYWEELARKNENSLLELRQETLSKESAIEELRRELIRCKFTHLHDP
jgi:hypothetical protein